MIRIYADTEEEKDRLIYTLSTSFKCPFIRKTNGCNSQRDCRTCVTTNMEIKVIPQIKEEGCHD